MLLDRGEDPLEEYNQETAGDIALDSVKREGFSAGGEYLKYGSRLANVDTMPLPMLETNWTLFRHCASELTQGEKLDGITTIVENVWKACSCAFGRSRPRCLRPYDMSPAAERSCALGERARTIVLKCMSLVGIVDPEAKLFSLGETNTEVSEDDCSETDGTSWVVDGVES